MDPIWVMYAFLGGVLLPLALLGAYATHRQRLRDEANEEQRPAGE